MADLATTCDLKLGDRVVAVEHEDVLNGPPVPGGRCHAATVRETSDAYVSVTYDDKNLGNPHPSQLGRDTYWNKAPYYRAWDGSYRFRLVKVTGIKALTVWQPWSFAIAMGWKPVENRGRRLPLKPGQVLAIHAGKTYDAMAILPEHHQELHDMPGDRWDDRARLLKPSAVLCLVRFTGVHDASECVTGEPGARRWCTPWSQAAQFHNEVTLIQALDHPVRCSGQRGIWKLPEESEASVRAQLAVPGGDR